MDEILTIIIFILIGTVFILLGIPLLLEKVKPNWFYGFRTHSTIKNKDLWYKINKQAGREFIISGIIVIIASIFFLTFQSYFKIIEILIILLLLVNLSVIIIIIRGIFLLRRLKK
jgi:uncharacterized membrane protein